MILIVLSRNGLSVFKVMELSSMEEKAVRGNSDNGETVS